MNPVIQSYLDRLSDHIFLPARVLNWNIAADTLWVPGTNR